jgi:hypothetical protein
LPLPCPFRRGFKPADTRASDSSGFCTSDVLGQQQGLLLTQPGHHVAAQNLDN